MKKRGREADNGEPVTETDWRLNNTARWVESAAKWLSEQKEPPHGVVNILKEKFGLRALEACRACALADALIRKERAAR